MTWGFRGAALALGLLSAAPAWAQTGAGAPAPAPAPPNTASFPAEEPPAMQPAAPAVATTPQPASPPASPPVSAPPKPSAARPETKPEPRPSRRWYGWQTLLVDVGSFAFLYPAGKVASEFAVVTLVGYFAGAPVVHLFHRNYFTALGSLGLRIGMPLVLGAFGELIGPSGEFGSYALITGAAGVVGAIAIDATALAYEPASASSAGPALNLELSRQRAVLGVRGAF